MIKNTSNRVIVNSFILYGKMGITMFISLYTTRLILSALGASDFGIYNIVGGTIGLMGFLNACLVTATQRFMSYYQGKQDIGLLRNVYNISLIIHVLMALIVCTFVWLIGDAFFTTILNIPEQRINSAKIVYHCMCITMGISLITVPFDSIVNAHENMLYYAVVGIIENILKLTVAFICVYVVCDKLVIYGQLMTMIQCILLVLMFSYCKRHYSECTFNPKKYWSTTMAKHITKYIGWNFMSSFSMTITNYGLSIVTNHFFGVLLNTALGLAQQIDTQLKVFSTNMLKALNPVIAKSEGEGKSDKVLRASLIGSKFSCYIFIYFSVPFWIEAPFIMNLWLGNVPEWAILFCRMQLIASIIGQLTCTFPTAIAAKGDIKKYSILTSVVYIWSICQTMIFFYLQLPPYSLYVSVIVFNVIVYRIIGMLIVHQKYCISLHNIIKTCVYPCVAVMASAFIAGSLPALFVQANLMRLVMTVTLSSLATSIAIYSIGTTKDEKDKLFTVITKFKNLVIRKK